MAPRTRGKTAAKAAKKAASSNSPDAITTTNSKEAANKLTEKPDNNSRLDYSFLASGGAPKKRGRPSNPKAAKPKLQLASVVPAESATKAAVRKSKSPRSTASRNPTKKPTEVVDLSENDSGESLGEDDTDTSSSEGEPTASDEEFIASDSDEEDTTTRKRKTSSATATHDDTDSDADGSSSNDSSDTSVIFEAAKKADKEMPKSKKVASKAKGTPNKRATPRSSSSKEPEVDSDSSSSDESREAPSKKPTQSKNASPRSSSSKAKKVKVQPDPSSSDDSSTSDDSSSSDDDIEQVPSSATPNEQKASAKAAAPAAASPKQIARDHGFKDPKLLCEQKLVFIGVGRHAFHKLSSNIYVPEHHALFTVANKLGSAPVPGAFYFSAFDATGGLRSFQRIRSPNDTQMPSFDPAWLVHERLTPDIACGITFAGLVIGLGAIAERPTRFGGLALMREVTAVVRDKNNPKTFHTILVTMWGDHTSAPAYVLGDVILVINAKQSTFQGVVRFSVGDQAAVVLASSMDTAREFTRKARKFQRRHTGDYLILPDGYHVWNENDE